MTWKAPPALRSTRGLRAASLAAVLAGVPLVPAIAAAGSIPEASAPVCVPLPELPCPGQGSSGGRSSSGGRTSYAPSSGGRSSKPASPELRALREVSKDLDKMFKPNPATIERLKRTQAEGAQALQDSELQQQQTEAQRRQQAARAAEAHRQQQVAELRSSLQLVPEGATPEQLRILAGSGFDTPGKLAVISLPAAPPPPPPPPPPPGGPVERVVPPERMSPELRTVVAERETVRERKKQLQETVERLESKSRLTDRESAELAKLQRDLDVAKNQETYLNFSINQALDARPAPRGGP